MKKGLFFLKSKWKISPPWLTHPLTLMEVFFAVKHTKNGLPEAAALLERGKPGGESWILQPREAGR